MQNQDKGSAPQPVPAARMASSRFALWTAAQRRTVLSLSAILLLFLAILNWQQPVSLSDPATQSALRSDEIADRLDPNTADAAALAAIPNVGEKRAAEIVDYREEFFRQHPNQTAYKTLDDLLRLKGFGVATVANLSPFLCFPANPGDPPAPIPYRKK